MKRINKPTKLSLNAQTIRQLSESRLAGLGGAGAIPHTFNVTCTLTILTAGC